MTLSERPDCPGTDTLQKYAAGRLDELETTRVRSHLSVCPHCVRAVEESLPTDHNSTPGLTDPGTDVTITGAFPSETLGEKDCEDDKFDPSMLSPPSSPDSMGSLGKYDVRQVVGRGGMGVVLEAVDAGLSRTVAIKVLSRHLATSSVARRRFLREGRAAAAINHPNVITIHAVEEQEGLPYLVMEFVDGRSLSQRIRDDAPLELTDVLRMGTQIATGLAAAHAQGVIHRDIKPSNVMLDGGVERVKIADFGLARVMLDNTELSGSGVIVGTPRFMSPEQVRGTTVDCRSDLFSLGCVLYAMIVGHSPFGGAHVLETTRQIVEETPPPLHQTDANVPRFLSDIVARLLEKDPDKRFQTAEEVAELLSRYLAKLNQTKTDQLADLIRQDFRVGGLKRHGRRWAVPLTIVVGVAIVSIAAWFAFFRTHEREPVEQAGPSKSRSSEAGVVITVAQSGEATFRTIGEALARAGPGAVIRVLDGSTYRETIQLDQARWNGVTIESRQRATLAAPNENARVIDLRGVSTVTVRGFRIRGSKNEHVVNVQGAVGGIVLEELIIDSPADVIAKASSVRILASASGVAAGAVVLRRSTITRKALGQCVYLGGVPGRAQAVRLEHNRLTGDGVLVLAWGPADAALGRVALTGNQFLGGTNGINLNLVNPPGDQNILVSNNTFYKTNRWLGLVSSSANTATVTVSNNLILGSQRVEARAAQFQAAATNWSFQSNVWERGPTTDTNAGLNGRIAEMKNAVSLVSRDKTHPGFLRPSEKSPLWTTGCGHGRPHYIGAWGPIGARTNHELMSGTINVSRSGQAQFSNVVDALRHAGPGAEIHVVDGQTYEEAIRIDRPDQWKNLKLVTKTRARLRAPESQPVVTISGTAGVVVRGFQMDVFQGQHGIEITGVATGVTIEDIHVSRIDNQSNEGALPLAYVHAGAAGTAANPIVVRKLVARGGGHGIAIGEQAAASQAGRQPVRWVRVEECTLLGSDQLEGYKLFLTNKVEDITITRNIFSGGASGMSLLLPEPNQSRRVVISRNTYHKLSCWMVLHSSQLASNDVRITENLIAGVSKISHIRRAATAYPRGWFDGNWWSQPVADVAAVAKPIADFEFQSESPERENFLRPDPMSIKQENQGKTAVPGRYGLPAKP